MFDIGFLELVIIAAVALLVIGPERLPGAVRTTAGYLRRIKRGFNEIRQEVEQELHNDAVMQDLKKARDEVSNQAEQWRQKVSGAGEHIVDQPGRQGEDSNTGTAKGSEQPTEQPPEQPPEKTRE
jgi:sec-independent protein translocase protein TatB